MTKQALGNKFTEVLIETNQAGKTYVKDRLDHPEQYKGPSEFSAVINFGDLFVKKGMKDSRINESEQWSKENLPPRGITVLEFSNPEVARAIEGIAEISRDDFYGDKEACEKYYELNRISMKAAANHLRLENGNYNFLSLVRAGVAAGEMLGVNLEDQVLVQTKRLHLNGENEGNIAIGIDYYDPEQMKELDGEHLVIADPAGATFSSVVGNVLFLIKNNIRPSKVTVINTVASHKGSLFAIEAIGEMGIDVEVVAGGYSPGMNNRYYLETKEGLPSVRDAGDGLNSFLPVEFQL